MEGVRAQFEDLEDDKEQLLQELQQVRCDQESEKVAFDQYKRLMDKTKHENLDLLKLKDRSLDQYQKKVNQYECLIQENTAKLQQE